MVELVLAVIGEECFKRRGVERGIGPGKRERALHQHAGAIADVGCDAVLILHRKAELAQRGVDGLDQVSA